MLCECDIGHMQSFVVAPLARIVAIFSNLGHARKRAPAAPADSEQSGETKKRRIHTVSEVGVGSRRRLFERLARHDIPVFIRSGDRGVLDGDEPLYWEQRKGKALCLCVVAAEGRPLEDLSNLDSLEKVMAFQWWQNLGLRNVVIPMMSWQP